MLFLVSITINYVRQLWLYPQNVVELYHKINEIMLKMNENQLKII